MDKKYKLPNSSGCLEAKYQRYQSHYHVFIKYLMCSSEELLSRCDVTLKLCFILKFSHHSNSFKSHQDRKTMFFGLFGGFFWFFFFFRVDCF